MKTSLATLQYAGDELFIGISPSGHAQVIDVNAQRSVGPSPTELLLLSLGGCTAADVISILHKKRELVTGYRVEVRGERREEHPRSYRKFEVHHIVSGRGVSEKSVQQAVELSSEKYCGVAATVRTTAEVVVTWAVEQEP